jgi:hypothetical protein
MTTALSAAPRNSQTLAIRSAVSVVEKPQRCEAITEVAGKRRQLSH